MGPIRILLADDHSLVRIGFRGLLRNLEGVEVVAEAGDGHTALELIQAHHPDVAIVDIAMPNLNGLELTARVVAESPRSSSARATVGPCDYCCCCYSNYCSRLHSRSRTE